MKQLCTSCCSGNRRWAGRRIPAHFVERDVSIYDYDWLLGGTNEPSLQVVMSKSSVAQTTPMAPATRKKRLEERILVKRFGMGYVATIILRENEQV